MFKQMTASFIVCVKQKTGTLLEIAKKRNANSKARAEGTADSYCDVSRRKY